jgi:hypothetical protein
MKPQPEIGDTQLSGEENKLAGLLALYDRFATLFLPSHLASSFSRE